ncbi:MULTISPECIES: glucosaminidase domain-containing protein, partial [Streptomyces]
QTVASIRRAQTLLLGMAAPDGLVSPGGPTLRALMPTTPPMTLPAVPGYPDDVIAAARDARRQWQVPASVSLAQWALESGHGAHMPLGSNNPFGIKARAGEPSVTSRTREVNAQGQEYYIEAPFRKFDSVA